MQKKQLTKCIFIMATIIRSAAPVFDITGVANANVLAQMYWGDLADELLFVLPFWQAQRMFSVGGSNQIALRVTNITDPGSVYVNWVVFEESMADTLTDPVEPGIYYFVLDDSFFNGPIFTNTNPIFQLDGIRNISSNPERNVLWARMGKEVDATDESEEFFVNFLAAECAIIGPGGGGGGVLSGARVPRGS